MQVSYKKTVFYALLLPGTILLLVSRFSPWTKGWVKQFLYPFERTSVGINTTPPAAHLKTKSKEELIQLVLDYSEKVKNYEAMERKLKGHIQENQQLQKFRNTPPPPGFKKIAGYILDRDPAKGGRVIRLNIGKRASIDIGFAVLSGNTIIGRISEVNTDSCTVNTLLDPGCSIPARIAGMKAYGTLSGAGEEGWKRHPFCVLKHLPRDLTYFKGKEVITSAYSEYLPPNLHIGTIQPRSDGSMVSVKKNLYKNVWVKPTAFDEDPSLLTVLIPIKPMPAKPSEDPTVEARMPAPTRSEAQR